MSLAEKLIDHEIEELKAKIVLPEEYKDRLADVCERAGGMLPDAEKWNHIKIEPDIYECFSPATLVHYQRESDKRVVSKEIRMNSHRTTTLLLPENANLDIVRSVRLKYVREMLEKWHNVGVAFIYKLNDLDRSYLWEHPSSGKLNPIVRFRLVEGYIDLAESEVC